MGRTIEGIVVDSYILARDLWSRWDALKAQEPACIAGRVDSTSLSFPVNYLLGPTSHERTGGGGSPQGGLGEFFTGIARRIVLLFS